MCVKTRHNRLGHPADKALNVLKTYLKYDNETIPPCEVFHKAKKIRDHFPLSEHKTSNLGELIHLDVGVLIHLLLLEDLDILF